MSKNEPTDTRKEGQPGRRPSRVVARAKKRSDPDLRRLARALIELAQQELEAEATDSSASAEPDEDLV